MPKIGTSRSAIARMVAGAYVDRVRIARPIREEHAVRLELEHCLGRRLRRHDRHAAAMLVEQPQDVALDAVVVGDDVIRRLRIAPLVRLARRDARREVEPLHRRTGVERAQRFVASASSPAPMTPRMTPTVLRCRVSRRVSTPSSIGTCAAVEPARAGRRRAPVGVGARQLAHDDAGDLRRADSGSSAFTP